MTRDFQTNNLADFEQFKIDGHFANFGQVINDPNCLCLLNLGRSKLFLLTLSNKLSHKKTPNLHPLTKSSRVPSKAFGTSYFQ